MADFKEIGRIAGQNSANTKQMIPEVVASFSEAVGKLFETKALDAKTKELIFCAFAIARQCEPCIAHHVKGLIEAGGTKEELAEVVGVGIIMSGGPGSVYGGKCLEAYDQLSK